MKYLKVLVIVLAATAVSLAGAVSVDAQARRAPAGGATARAVPRTVYAPGGGAHPGGGPVYPYHPYYPYYRYPYYPYYGYGYPYYGYGYPYYPYGPGLTIGLGFGFPYGAVSVGLGYSYGYYGGYGYGYPYAPGYVAAAPAYGGVRITGAPRNAQVFADGYYAGVVDNFDGSFQHLDLTPGPHRVEIRVTGAPPMTFDVHVQPGQTITYHADLPHN